MMSALGVGPWVYVPYCFFNLISPILSVIYGFTGFTIEKNKEKIKYKEPRFFSRLFKYYFST